MAMNKVQEKVSAVIHKNDLNDLEAVTQQALQAPVPDARAAELRSKLLIFFRSLLPRRLRQVRRLIATGRPPKLDQKLIDEYTEWRKEYEQWLVGAAKTYTAAP